SLPVSLKKTCAWSIAFQRLQIFLISEMTDELRTILRLWIATIYLSEFVEAASLDKDQMTAFLYILIAIFLFFIVLIFTVCIHICRLSWAGLKERRGGNMDDDQADLADYPRQFRVRVERATETRRDSSL
ncbi:hypothetical protein PENTCL1PPCAC_5896, partial [Pristionchus entomophagus]